jgi:hypothetical protein
VPLTILIPPTVLHSSSIIRRWYNRPTSGRRTKWTQSHPTNAKFTEEFNKYPKLYPQDRTYDIVFICRVFWVEKQLVKLSWQGIGWDKTRIYTRKYNTEKKRIQINVTIGIRTRDPSVRRRIKYTLYLLNLTLAPLGTKTVESVQ